MMPLIVKDFSWHQTPTTVSIVVPIPRIVPQKTDVLTSNNYVRIHCHPHIFEAFLWGTVADDKGACTIDQEKGTVFLNFPKTFSTPEEGEGFSDDDSTWPSLEVKGLDRLKKKVLRDAAVNMAHQRHSHDAETAANRRDQLRQTSVMEQIRMDEEAREKISRIKKAEGDRALEDMKRWSVEGGLLPGETMSGVILPLSGGSKDQVSNRDNLNLERLAASAPKISTSSSSIWSEFGACRVGGGDGDLVKVREPQRITVAFTPREFPTPARESSAPLEEEWLKKQAEARHLSGFNEPDLRPEERDPDWLLQKGRSLMKADCPLGAVSAYSLGIKLAPKLPQLYAERAKAHLHLRNFMKVVDDSSLAIELYTPKVNSNAVDRLKCHLTRADGFDALKMYPESLLDLKEALRLNPEDEQMKKRVNEVSVLVDEIIDSDVD